MKRRLDPKGALIGFGMFVVLWQILSWIISRPIMPSPVTVLPLFVREMPGDLGLHFLASAGRVLSAIALSVLAKCQPCAKIHIKKARDSGFSQEAIDEAAWMAIAFGGSPAMMFYNGVKEA